MAYQRNTNFYVPTLATPKADPAKVATFNSIGNWVDPNRKAQIASAGLSQEQEQVNKLGQQANASPDHRYGIIEGINKLQEKQNQDLASLQPELRKLSEQNIRQEAEKITQAYGQGGEGANSFGNQYAASVRGNNSKSIDMARAGNVVVPAGDALEKFGSIGVPMSDKLTHALADSDYNHTFEYHPDSVNASMAGYSGTSFGDGTGGAAPGQSVGGEDQKREGWGSTFMPGGEYDRGGGADAQWKYKHDYDVNGKYVGTLQPTGMRDQQKNKPVVAQAPGVTPTPASKLSDVKPPASIAQPTIAAKQPESQTPAAMTQNEDGTWSSYGGNRDLKQMSRADKLNEILENGGGQFMKQGQDVTQLHDTALDTVIKHIRGQSTPQEADSLVGSGFFLPQQGQMDSLPSPLAGVIDPPGAYEQWTPPKENYRPGEVMYGAPWRATKLPGMGWMPEKAGDTFKLGPKGWRPYKEPRRTMEDSAREWQQYYGDKGYDYRPKSGNGAGWTEGAIESRRNMGWEAMAPAKENYRPGEVMYGAPGEKMSGIRDGSKAMAPAPVATIAMAPEAKLAPKPMLAGVHPYDDIFSRDTASIPHATGVNTPQRASKWTDPRQSGSMEAGMIDAQMQAPPQTPEHRAVVNGYKKLKEKNPPMAQFLTKIFTT